MATKRQTPAAAAKKAMSDIAKRREAEAVKPFLFDRKQVAEILGVTLKTLERYIDDGLPVHSKHPFQIDIRECIRWRTAQLADAAAKVAARGQGNVARDRLAASQKQKVDLEVAKMRANVVDAALIPEILNRVIAMVANQHDGLGPRLAGELAGSDNPAFIETRIFDESRAIRLALANELESYAQQLEREALEAATATSQVEPSADAA